MNFIKMIPRYRVNEANNKTLLKRNNKRKTTEQYKEELKVKNPNVEALGEYVNARTKILHRYKLCGHTSEVPPHRILSGSGCDYCNRQKAGQKNKKTAEQYKEELKLKNPNIDVLENYIDSHTKILHRYKICEHEAKITPTGALQGTGCLICTNKRLGKGKRKSHDAFIKEISIKNPLIKIVGKYVKQTQRIETLCSICNYNWYPYPSDLLSGRGCPNCNMSHGEREIMRILELNNIKYTSQKSFKNLVGLKGGLLSYDFYLPIYNLLIEFQGEQHEKPYGGFFGGEKQFKIQQEHDKRKREYAKQNNINLLEIWYYDIDNIESILLQKINEIKNNLKLESLETAISA